MRKIINILLSLTLLVVTISCSKRDVLNDVQPTYKNVKIIKDLYAPYKKYNKDGSSSIINKAFKKFNFEKGVVVLADDWDIAFRGTEIIVNGGIQRLPEEPKRLKEVSLAIVKGNFNKLKSIPKVLFKQDNEYKLALPTGDKIGWYSYDLSVHIISPIAGKIILIKTHKGHYVKMEILNHYKNGDDTDMQKHSYYTFKYVYNSIKGEEYFEN